MNKVFVVVGFFILTACSSPSDVLTPTWEGASADQLAIWHDEVTNAVSAWQLAIGEDCRFPLYVGEDGSPVVLFSRTEWPHAMTISGIYDGSTGQIDVYGGDPAVPTRHGSVLLHEIGHAIGLDHTSEGESVMFTYKNHNNTKPSVTDALNARSALGCD